MEKAGGKPAPVFSYMTFFNNLTVNGGQFNEIFPNPTRVSLPFSVASCWES
ncbi:hypothetical protein [Dysosmobacter sp.]|uniref:hypothetical protein n=1 Tax=Dysosmobacter sp. TaxID=2591382 RepID=UPI003FD73F98